MQRTIVGFFMMITFMLGGLIIGTAIWAFVFSGSFGTTGLMASVPIGTSPDFPIKVDLPFLFLSLSITFRLNLGSLLGAFVGFYAFNRQ